LAVAQDRAVKKQEEKEKAVPKARVTRKKPSTIPTGEPGQYGGMFFTCLYFFLLLTFLQATSLAPEIIKKLEDYELSKSAQLEKIEEMSQAIARLTAENRSIRQWVDGRIHVMWDQINRRDERIGIAMKKVLEHAEEMSRHLGLREAAEQLEGLLTVPVRSWDAQSLPTKPTPLHANKTPIAPNLDTPLPSTTSLLKVPLTTSLPIPPALRPPARASNGATISDADPTLTATTTDTPMFPEPDVAIEVGMVVAQKPTKRPASDPADDGKKRRKVD